MKKAIDVLDTFPEHEIYFIPVRIDDCEPAYEKLEDIHWADLFPSYEKGLNQILGVLIPEIKQDSSIPKTPVEVFPIVKTEQEEKTVSQPQSEKPKYQLRKDPMTVSDEEFKKVFGLDENQRPLEYLHNDFKDNGDGTITDNATGLMWQKSGSPDYMNYEKAKAYIQELNSKKFAGHNDWRLPTVDELKSLLTPKEMNGDLYINSIFDKTQRWCWTSDRRASGGAWYVRFSNGSVDWFSFDSGNYVRAVRSIE